MSESLQEEVARLRRTIERERRARLQAEAISESALLDVTHERKRLELLRAVATAANEAASLEQACEAVLELVCSFLEWPFGHVYDAETGPPIALVPYRSWHATDRIRWRATRQLVVARPLHVDEGLPGRAVRERRPVWSSDLARDPEDSRFRRPRDVSVRSGIAVCVRDGARPAAVIELLHDAVVVCDERTEELLAFAATQLGRVAERSRAETDLLHARDELEERVCDRTVELEAAIAELRLKISEQLRSEKALRLSEARYQRLFDNTHDLIYTRDIDGILTSMNAAGERILGYAREELIGTHVSGVLAEEYRSKGILGEWKDMTPGEQRVFEIEVLTRDGRRVPLEVSACLAVEDGLIVGLQGTGRDITERRQTQELARIAHDAAIEAARTKATFLASMSHEIRTPLNGIIGLTHLLERTPLTSKQRDYVGTLMRSGAALLHVVDDVLDFSKIESGKMTIEAAEVELRVICLDVVRVFAEQAEAKRLELLLDVADDVPSSLVGDAFRVRQILTNLVGNAMKFTHDGEVVLRAAVTLRTGDGVFVRFEVTDTGIGVDPETAKKLFTPFTQADGSTTRNYGGTGLGLAICKQLVELMGGEIGLESAAGEGSTFWFTTPFAAPEVEALSVARSLEGVRVLVVDDYRKSRELIGRHVTSRGAECLLVSSPAEALGALLSAGESGSPFDVAVVDLDLPGTSGLAFASAVASEPSTAWTRIVVLSTHDAHSRIADSAHVDEWRTKPFDANDLETSILRALSRELRSVQLLVPSAAVRSERARVLLVEDYPINRVVAVGYLDDLGCHVDEAENGAQALEMLERSTYDIVLMDCQMPVLDGLSATRAIRVRERERGLPHTTVVALTANALDADRERCLAAGMDDFLAKPFRPSDLEALLDRHVLRRTTRVESPSEVASESARVDASETEPALDPETFRQLRVIAERREVTISQFYAEYVSHATAGLEVLRRATADAGALAPAAHSLKGASAMYGAMRVARICAEIESLDADEVAVRAGALLDALAGEVAVVASLVTAGDGALEAGAAGV